MSSHLGLQEGHRWVLDTGAQVRAPSGGPHLEWLTLSFGPFSPSGDRARKQGCALVFLTFLTTWLPDWKIPGPSWKAADTSQWWGDELSARSWLLTQMSRPSASLAQSCRVTISNGNMEWNITNVLLPKSSRVLLLFSFNYWGNQDTQKWRCPRQVVTQVYLPLKQSFSSTMTLGTWTKMSTILIFWVIRLQSPDFLCHTQFHFLLFLLWCFLIFPPWPHNTWVKSEKKEINLLSDHVY